MHLLRGPLNVYLPPTSPTNASPNIISATPASFSAWVHLGCYGRGNMIEARILSVRYVPFGHTIQMYTGGIHPPDIPQGRKNMVVGQSMTVAFYHLIGVVDHTSPSARGGAAVQFGCGSRTSYTVRGNGTHIPHNSTPSPPPARAHYLTSRCSNSQKLSKTRYIKNMKMKTNEKKALVISSRGSSSSRCKGGGLQNPPIRGPMGIWGRSFPPLR